MRVLLTTLKKIFFWNYPRNTWQWDLLCVVILIFIFLTPKSWLDNGERPKSIVHPSPVMTKVVLTPELVANEEDKSEIEQRVRAVTGRDDVRVMAVRKVVGADGRTVRFEVDIE